MYIFVLRQQSFYFFFPKVLQDEYGGWKNKKILDDFAAYARLCFERQVY